MAFILTGDWDKVQKLFGNPMIAGNTMKRIKILGMKRVLAYLEGQIKRNIRSSGKLADKPFATNAPMTLELKKPKTKPLIDTGDMMGSVTRKYIDENNGFVGLLRGEKHTDGGSVADIGMIHEFGAIVDKKTIPARPFIGPVLKKFKKDAGEVYLKAAGEVLSG